VDFLKVLRSLEELLYELMAWLVFYPRTLWRVVARPADMVRYSDEELNDNESQRYADTLSPPLFLMLTVLVAHGVELGLGARAAGVKTEIGKVILDSEQNLLVLRSILFSLFALVAATTAIRKRGAALDRTSLRRPFFAQCYLAAPFALALSTGATLALSPPGRPWWGTALAVAGLAWYLSAETTWFRRELQSTRRRAFALGLWSIVRAAAYSVVVAVLLFRS